jgi:hypothetical protein
VRQWPRAVSRLPSAVAISLAAITVWTSVLADPGAAGAVGARPASDPGCVATRRLVCVDRADGGHRVNVRVGQTVRVELGGSGLQWSDLHELGPRLLRSDGAPRMRVGAISASYLAATAGRTALQASGAPKCSPGQACPQFLLLWRVQVVVRAAR